MKIDLNQPITFTPLTAQSYPLLANFIVIISIVCLFISGGLLIKTLNQLQKQPQDITASQLLNQRSIEEAINLLENQTVSFSSE